MSVSKAIIRVIHLEKSFSKGERGEPLKVLAGIDLSISEGEFISILGPSGCGKSTFLHILAGLDKQDEGEVYLDDRLITGPGPDHTMIFQDYSLFPWMTVKKNIELGLRAIGIPPEKREAICREHIQLVHLEGFEDHYPHELSGGMKQRVAIARGFALNPRVLFMDEPFGALDAQTRVTLQQELIRIFTSTRKTIVFVTHNVSEAVFLSDRIVVCTKRPMKVKTIFCVEIERPRDRFGVSFNEFCKGVAQVLDV